MKPPSPFTMGCLTALLMWAAVGIYAEIAIIVGIVIVLGSVLALVVAGQAVHRRHLARKYPRAVEHLRRQDNREFSTWLDEQDRRTAEYERRLRQSGCACSRCQTQKREAQLGQAMHTEVTLTPNGQPQTLTVRNGNRSLLGRETLSPDKQAVFGHLTGKDKPCTEGGPCRTGHRRVVRDLLGNRVATLCTHCGKHEYWEPYLKKGTAR